MATRSIAEFGKFQSEQQQKSSAGSTAFAESDPTIYLSGFAMQDDLKEDITALTAEVDLLSRWVTKWVGEFKEVHAELAALKASIDENKEDDLLDSLMYLMRSGVENNDIPSCDSDSTITATKVTTLSYYNGSSTDHKGELELYGAQDLGNTNYNIPYLTKSAGTGSLAWAKLDETSLDLDNNGGMKIEFNKWRVTGASETAVSSDLFVVRPTGADPLPKYVSFQEVLDNGGGETAIITIGDGEWWQLGGDYSTCYGNSIGDGVGSPAVIDLLNKQLGAGSHSPAHTDNWSVIAGYKFKVLDTTDNDGNVDVGSFQVTGGMSVKLKSYFGDNMKLASGKSFSVGTDVLTIREVDLVDHGTGETITVKILST